MGTNVATRSFWKFWSCTRDVKVDDSNTPKDIAADRPRKLEAEERRTNRALHASSIPRKEVIQPHLPVRLPCYDFTPITESTLDACLEGASPLVSPAASGVPGFRGVTGGVYKARERIHRGVLTRGY